MVRVIVEDSISLQNLAEILGWRDEFPEGDDFTPEDADGMEEQIKEFLEERGIQAVTAEEAVGEALDRMLAHGFTEPNQGGAK